MFIIAALALVLAAIKNAIAKKFNIKELPVTKYLGIKLIRDKKARIISLV